MRMLWRQDGVAVAGVTRHGRGVGVGRRERYVLGMQMIYLCLWSEAVRICADKVYLGVS
jgi:hypothetical protein